MATEVIMPQMGFDMKEGTLVRWLKAEGEAIRKGEPLAEIETDKAVVEVEAYASGVLRKVLIGEGTTVPVGKVIGIIAGPDEELPLIEPVPPSASGQTAPAPAELTAHVAVAPKAKKAAERLKASPLARKEAEERGIDLTQVVGTGPGGRVTREDVLKFAAQREVAAPAAQKVVALSRMRQAIARNMSRSKREIPHFYVTIDVDMTEALKLREQLNQTLQGDTRVSINDLVLAACARALPKHPAFNASYTESGIQLHKEINLGVAIAMEGGLVAPAILDCEKKGLAEIARASSHLVERARSGVLMAQEYTGATFNVTNLGMYNVESFSAIITPPQSAALAVGSVRKGAVMKDGQAVAADMMKLTLSIDHRVADGVQAALFLTEVRKLLGNPVRLLLEP